MKNVFSLSLLSLALLTASLTAQAQVTNDIPTRESSQASASNGFYYPANRWAYQHMEQLYPTVTLDKGVQPSVNLQENQQNLDNLSVTTHDGKTITLAEMLVKNYTDAFLVVKDNKIVYERYFNGQNERSRHQMMSVTKSISATAIQPLFAQGKIDPSAKIIHYVPELAGSAWGDATVAQVMDMTVSLDFDEDYDNPNSGFNNYLKTMKLAGDGTSIDAQQNMRHFLTQIKKGPGEHGKVFTYATPNTDVICWIAERAAGKQANTIIEQNIWSKIGAERDAYILQDQIGSTFCGAGFNATARDLARFGMVMANEGKFNHQQIVDPVFIETLKKGGSHEAFNHSHYGNIDFLKNWTYKDQWWIRNNANHAFAAIGIYGQTIYVDPTANVVVVKQTSRKVAQNSDDGELFNAIDIIINKIR